MCFVVNRIESRIKMNFFALIWSDQHRALRRSEEATESQVFAVLAESFDSNVNLRACAVPRFIQF
jgi:hypothetical protein